MKIKPESKNKVSDRQNDTFAASNPTSRCQCSFLLWRMGDYKPLLLLIFIPMCKKIVPTLTVTHCVNHRLELAVRDAVKHITELSHIHMFIDSEIETLLLSVNERGLRPSMWAKHERGTAEKLVIKAGCLKESIAAEDLFIKLTAICTDAFSHYFILNVEVN